MTTLNIKTEVKLRGRYRIKKFDASGQENLDTGWFDNLITNQGLDQIGGYQPSFNSGGPYILCACSVGTGTTPPAVSDTLLTAFGAASGSYGTNVITPSSLTYVAGPPSYWSCIMEYTFAAGTVTGTWSEIGVGNWLTGSTTQPYLFSHALIQSGGSPTTITVLSTESLQVTYELDYYINTTTNPYSFVMSTVTYSGNYLRSRVATTPDLNQYLINSSFGSSSVFITVYNGSIGSITGFPSGASSGGVSGSTTTQSSYTNGTYFIQFQSSFAVGQGNLTGGISALEVFTNAQGSWQFSVSPVIPKTSSYQMQLNYTISWARYP